MSNQTTPLIIKHLKTILFIAVICLSAANIAVSASLSNTGEKLRELETTARELKQKNQILEQDLVVKRSLTKIAKQAEPLNFKQNPQILTISPDETVAQVFDSRPL